MVTTSDYHCIPPAPCPAQIIKILHSQNLFNPYTVGDVTLYEMLRPTWMLDNEGPWHGIWIFASRSSLRFTCSLQLISAAAATSLRGLVNRRFRRSKIGCLHAMTARRPELNRGPNAAENNEIGSDIGRRKEVQMTERSLVRIATKN